MKRFYFIAAMAILAVGCQKTEIQNEVQTPIGFSTEVGKQTRAIVDGQAAAYKTDQPFAVFAYGHQGDAEATKVMDNVEISYADAVTGDDGSVTTPAKWSASTNSTKSTKYYWPNDPTTTLNFYAYSPATQTENAKSGELADHQKLTFLSTDGSGVNFSEDSEGLTLKNYSHDNQYRDFMVATPVIGAKYSNTDPMSLTTISESAGTVPVVFNHQLTQIVFNVTTDKSYPGVTFTVQKIILKNIVKVADYSNNKVIKTYTKDGTTDLNGTWTAVTNQDLTSYNVFPADTDEGAQSTNTMGTEHTTVEAEVDIVYNSESQTTNTLTTTGITVIPQNMSKVQSAVVAGTDTYKDNTTEQLFAITYSIEGEGVATETVIKHVPFFAYDAESAVNWQPNKKITYTVKIGLNEILFEPSVADWTAETGNEYTFQQ